MSGRKATLFQSAKKESKNCLKNSSPIILFPIFSKIFERLISNALFKFFVQNQLFTDCQSGFIPRGSYVLQLLSITQETHKSLDCDPSEEVRGVFPNIFKAFGKIWNEGQIFKLKTYDVEGKLVMLLGNVLKSPKQRVVLNGLSSSWEKILAGVPQGSMLRLLLFLIYTNDLPYDIYSIHKTFADDTSLFSKVKDPGLSLCDLNYGLEPKNQ